MESKATQIFPNAVKDARTEAKKTADGFQNFEAKLGVGPNYGRGAEGTEDNLLSHGHYTPNLITRNRLQLEWAFRGSWIVGKVIKCIAEDMTRESVMLTTNEAAEVIPDFMVELSRLQIMTSFCETIQWGRLYGGAIGVMQIAGQQLNTPLNIDSVGKDQFKGITTYDRWQVYPVLTDLIEGGPEMGLPRYYDIVLGTNINDPGMEPGGMRTDEASGRVRVHHTRCFRMIGIKLPFFQAITEMLWGESILENMWDRLISFDDATMNVAGLIHRANLRTIKFESLRQIMAAGGEAQQGLEAQVEFMRRMQSNEGITAMDKEDEFMSYSYSFAGIPETLIQFAQQVSGAADIPLVRLFNQSPAGLSATGESDMRMYYDGIKSRQESMMRNPFDTVLKIMWRSFTGKSAPKDLSFKFVPLWQMPATDKAIVAKTNTDTVVAAHQEGLIDTATAMQELKQNSAESGMFTHITDEAISDAENEEPPMPDADEPDASETGEPGGGPRKPEEKSKPKGAKAVADAAWKKIKKFLARDERKAPVNDPGIPGTMKEFYKGTLKSSSGSKVTSKKQALAIGYSEEGKDTKTSDRQRIKDWLAKHK